MNVMGDDTEDMTDGFFVEGADGCAGYIWNDFQCGGRNFFYTFFVVADAGYF